MSATTTDAKRFQEYFNNCPLVHITGRNFDVKTLYTAPGQTGPDYVTLAAATAVNIHKNKEPGDILIFLPGGNEIEKVCSLVRDDTQGLDVFP